MNRHAAHTCPNCDRPIIDAGYICHTCTTELRADLIQVARLHHQIDITLTRQDRIGAPGKTTADDPLMYSQKAREGRFIVTNVITTWTRHVETTRGTTMPDQHKPPATHGPACKHRCTHESCAHINRPVPPDAAPEVRAALWLTTQADWIRHRPEAQQISDEIHDAARTLRRVIDRMPARRYVGPCDICETDMYAHPWNSEISCPAGCDITYNISDRRKWLLQQADDHLANAALIARAVTDLGEPIKSSRIRQWASRGRLIPRGTDDAGRPLYAVRDVRDLLRQDERQRRKTRAS